jgi:outer membrane protein assembly factor BamD (BamD/ComL family)
MKQFLSVGILIMALAMFAPLAKAQGTVRSGPDPSTLRDPELEKDSMHNLEVARNYFKLKKAYVAALKRTEEIIAGNPTFTRIDEALFMAGSSSLFLAEKKGKQDPTLYITYDGNTKKTLTAEEFREMGRDYLSRLVQEYPESSFRSQAEDALRLIGGGKKQ